MAELDQGKANGYSLVFDEEHGHEEEESPYSRENHQDENHNDEEGDDGVEEVEHPNQARTAARKSMEEGDRIVIDAQEAALLAVSPHASNFSSEGDDSHQQPQTSVRLTAQDKLRLIKPMLFVYIAPLVLVYFFE